MLINPPLQDYFRVIKNQIAMPQQHFILNRAPEENTGALPAVKNNLESKRNNIEKACKHRSENGWCSKSQGQCLLLTGLFFKH